MTKFNSVEDYLGAQPEPARAALTLFRDAIRRAAPGAVEAIAYGMPAYSIDGEPLVHFAGWKKHYSLFAATGRVVEEFSDELKGFAVEKGTIRFPLGVAVPVDLIERIVRFRAQGLASGR